MYSIDPRIRGLPAKREQVLTLYESVNQPHIGIPGKKAGPSRAYIVGLRGGQGLSVFVYLHLPEAGDCAVYASERRVVQAQDYAAEEAEAMAFVESMGFIVDNMHFRKQPQARQDEMLKSFPVFQREPPAVRSSSGDGKAQDASSVADLGRLLSSF